MPAEHDRPTLLYVLGLAPKKIGGIEKFLRYFALELDRRGWNTVLCFDGPIAPEFRDYISFPGVTLEDLPHQGHLGQAAAAPLRALLRKHRPQVFVYAFHGVMRVFPWLARLAGTRRIFFNDHSSRPPGQVAAPLSLPRRIAGRVLTLPLTGIVAVSQFTASTGTALGLTTMRPAVVPNGIEVFPPDPARGAAFRARFHLPAAAPLIGQVCWMVDVKGVDILLNAFAQVLSTHPAGQPAPHLVLVGEGPRLDDYRTLAASLGIAHAVTFTGMLANPTASGLFDALDIYTQLSLWQEASGLAVLEAMSALTPVIASNIGGLPENVLDGSTGLLVPPGDITAAAAALTRLLASAALRASFAQAGLQATCDRHRIQDTAVRYADILLNN